MQIGGGGGGDGGGKRDCKSVGKIFNWKNIYL